MDESDIRAHWERIYHTKLPAELSWHQSAPVRSLELILATGAGPASHIIDVGGGDATLVDALLDRRAGQVTVLDISAAALDRARARLGARARDVTWIEADVRRAELPPSTYDVWHDRALFHFLIDADDRRRYVEAAQRSVKRGGWVIVGAFAADGPTRCSGRDVARYSAEQLHRELGPELELVSSVDDVHRTPAGTEQRFTFGVFRRR